MSPDGVARGVERLRESLPTRFGACTVRLRSPTRTATPAPRSDMDAPEPSSVEFVVDGARATLVLSGSDAVDDPEAEAVARRAAVATDGSALYGVVSDESLTVRRAAATGRDQVVCDAVPLERLRSVLALVAWHVRAETAALYARFESFRRAVEPLASARLTHCLDDPGFAERLRDSLRAAGPADDDVAVDGEARTALAAQASGLCVDALVTAGPAALLRVDDATESPATAWEAIVGALEAGTDDRLFDPAETPLADVALRPPPSAPEPAFAAAVGAARRTLQALDRASVTLDESVLARLFERFVPIERRWRWGQVYTPTAVARLLADWTVDDRDGDTVDRDGDTVDDRDSDGPTDAVTVFDPACGTGRLLRAAVESRLDHGQPPPTVVGRDVFSLPVALAARSLPDDVTTDLAAGDFFACVPAASGGADAAGKRGQNATADESTEVDHLPPVDAVVMNPPYTRREALGDDYVTFVRNVVAGGSTVDRRSGLASYFLRHAASFLREGGRMGVVVGSSWLNADYGAGLQSFLLDTFRIRGVVSAPRHHLVDTAEVNAVLLLLERTADETTRDEGVVPFVRLRASPEEVVDGGGLASVVEDARAGTDDDPLTRDGASRRRREEPGVEVVERRQRRLRGTTGGDGFNPSKWGPYVRAPPVYWTVLDRCGDRFVDFHDLESAGWATLSYGTRSGAPDFFYLPNAHHDVVVDGDTLRVVPRDGTGLDEPCRLARRHWMHRVDERVGAGGDDENGTVGCEGGDGDRSGSPSVDTDGWLPNYLLKRTTGVDRLRFDVSELDLGRQLRYVVRFPEARSELGAAARRYVEWGESHDVEACPHCRRAKPFPAYCPGDRWYDISTRLTRGAVLPNKDVHATHAYWTPSRPLWVHQSLYGIDAADPPLVAALLNSTLGLLMLEAAGRVNLGEGALDLMTGDHRAVPLVDPRGIESSTRDRLVERFEAVAARSIGSVFEECGARRRGDVALRSVRADRRALDEVVMGDVLGLSSETQLEVYRGVVGMVDDRLTKARRGR